jgi:hypothetical protein
MLIIENSETNMKNGFGGFVNRSTQLRREALNLMISP